MMSNEVLEGLLFGKLGKSLFATDAIKKQTYGSIWNPKNIFSSKPSAWRALTAATATEGFWEEGLQFSISEYQKNQALENTGQDKAEKGFIGALVDGLDTMVDGIVSAPK